MFFWHIIFLALHRYWLAIVIALVLLGVAGRIYSTSIEYHIDLMWLKKSFEHDAYDDFMQKKDEFGRKWGVKKIKLW